MRKLHYLIFSLALIASGLLVGQNSAYADCNGWFSFSSTCNNTPPYCPNGSCTLSGGLESVGTAIGPNLTNQPFSQFIQDIVVYLLSFISIRAVIYIIYAGVQVLIGAGDEEKMKKAKNIILYVAIGLALMWFSYAIVQWILVLLSKTRGTTFQWIIPQAYAETYTESEIDTFREYENKVRVSLQTIEGELKVNKTATVGSLQNLKSLVQGAFDRLPDTGDAGTENDTAKRAVDIDIDVAIKNPSDRNLVGNALSRVNTFMSSARIQAITGDVSATPSEGNAPLTVSFRANNIKDPSGTTPESGQYIWWMRGNGGRRIELGRGPSLTYTFQNEGTFTVFLDVVSGSRNKKGRTDVLPLSVEKQIEVKPKLGDIILLINGVNVSNLTSLKVSPNIGNLGVLFDATASRAAGNGTITETTWDFGNGNTYNYKGSPLIERQIYANQGAYPIRLTIKTNTNQTFTKDFQLIVRDPAAVIQADRFIGHVGEEMSFRSISYFTTQNNIEYTWTIQDENNTKVLKSVVGSTLSYKFDKIGNYIISLTSRSPNGNTDTDSKTVTIESREPVINLNNPTSISKEQPNTFVFDASKSYDPDTMSRKGLTFTWRLNGEKVTLDKLEQDGSKGQLTFDQKGTHTIALTVANAYGKVKTMERTFEVSSTLSVNFVALPEVAPFGTLMNFIAKSENAVFYEWNMGDGSAPINGTKRMIQHSYRQTGVYRVTLTVKNAEGTESNQISKTVYATDTNSPFASISISNGSNTAYEDLNACKQGAIVLNRSESSNLDGSKSINIDGTNNGLSYTWEYFGKVKTTPYVSEKFSDLGCFPIKLTVRGSNGTSHTMQQYIALKNQIPELTGISATLDIARKDSQKVLVKVTANGARDPDGVITSYIWYYTTESDKEPQNVQITQTNQITFVLPNITEKYYFGVIIEDNDGGRINSSENGAEQSPLIIDNQNGNVYLPLISLSAPKTGLVDEKLSFSVDAKTILGTNISGKSEYSWDFDGDGKMEIQKSTNPRAEYTYKNSGTYSVKVRVTHNGVSNTKYQTISIKNPLKAAFYGFKLPSGDIYLLNASKGSYDRVTWNIANESIDSLYSYTISKDTIGTDETLGTMTVSLGESDSQTTQITMKDVIELSGTGGTYQSSPLAYDNIIRVSGPGEKVLISLIGNTGTRYVIDEDTSIDSDLDGITDNDEDNKGTPSYNDGSVFSIQDFGTTGNKTRNIKLSVYNGNSLVSSEILTLSFDYINSNTAVSGEGISLGTTELSEFDKKELDSLATMIRSLSEENRIILMQYYNTLIENWDDSFSKVKTLLDIQEYINTSNLSQTEKESFTKTIDAIIIGDATTTDNVSLAAKVMEGLIPSESTNRSVIMEKLSAIQAHPTLFAENKILAKEILEMVEADDTIENKYKLHIKNQLLIIIGGGQVVSSENTVTETEGSGGIMGFISGLVTIFFILVGIIILVIIVAYFIYRSKKRNDDIGFQDFLIDSIFHNTSRKEHETIMTTSDVILEPSPIIQSTPEAPMQESGMSQIRDPLAAESLSNVSSQPESNTSSYDPLKDFGGGESMTLDTSSVTQNTESPVEETQISAVPDWLKGVEIQKDNREELVPDEDILLVPGTAHTADEDIKENSLSNENTSIGAPTPIEGSTTPPVSPPVQNVLEENPEDILIIKQDIPPVTETEESYSVTIPETTQTEPSLETIPEASKAVKAPEIIPPPPLERNDGMPDWLAIDPLEQKIESTPQVIEETSDSTESTDKNTSDTLPDWLIQSVDENRSPTDTSSESEEGESLLDIIESREDGTQESKKKEAPAKKKKAIKKQGDNDSSAGKSSPTDHIPDWLK